jgi:hypothetical protein
MLADISASLRCFFYLAILSTAVSCFADCGLSCGLNIPLMTTLTRWFLTNPVLWPMHQKNFIRQVVFLFKKSFSFFFFILLCFLDASQAVNVGEFKNRFLPKHASTM